MTAPIKATTITNQINAATVKPRMTRIVPSTIMRKTANKARVQTPAGLGLERRRTSTIRFAGCTSFRFIRIYSDLYAL